MGRCGWAVEGTWLEIRHTGNRIGGSNPPISASVGKFQLILRGGDPVFPLLAVLRVTESIGKISESVWLWWDSITPLEWILMPDLASRAANPKITYHFYLRFSPHHHHRAEHLKKEIFGLRRQISKSTIVIYYIIEIHHNKLLRYKVWIWKHPRQN